MHRCLYCYKEIQEEQNEHLEFHERCSKKFFGTKTVPILDYAQKDLLKLAKKIIKSRSTIAGVQPKLSLSKMTIVDAEAVEKLTLIGIKGNFILKPRTTLYPNLPELEDATMHLAALAKIKTVPHTLISLKSGELAYLTKRLDRKANKKVHMEDMCQITERQTEHKYKGSYEQIAKKIRLHSHYPGLDLVNFYELLLFCFLTGNNDMHLKNFSLIKTENTFYQLCPAYDLLASSLVVEGDEEELALNLNGKKKHLKRKDFENAMKGSGINAKAAQNILSKFEAFKDDWLNLLSISFLSEKMKLKYGALIEKRFKVIYS